MATESEKRLALLAQHPSSRVLMEFLTERQAQLDKDLRICPAGNFQQVQGRALEIEYLIKLLSK